MKVIKLQIEIWIFCFAFFSSLQLSASGKTDTIEKYNVLMIIVDDLSSIIHHDKKEKIHIPNIKKLMENGRSFQRAYCQAPLCNPSRTSFLTGLRPSQNNIYTNDPHFRGVNLRSKTIPQHFKENGYYTVGIGKIFHNWGQLNQGDPISWSEKEKYHWGTHSSDWYIPNRPYQLHTDIPKGEAVQREAVPDEAYLDGRITASAQLKMRELVEVPFFLAVGLWKPHLPFNAPKQYWDLYDRNNLPSLEYNEPVSGVPDIAYVNSNEARSYRDVDKIKEIPESQKLELRHGYLAAISYLDAQVGKLLSELERLGLQDKTHIVFMSDHGYHAGEHGQFGKWTNFEIGTKVPLIISSPIVQQKGRTSKSIVELIDIFPTLIDLCNLPQPKIKSELQGESLLPILLNSDAETKMYAVSEIARPLGGEETFNTIGSTIRSQKYRYTFWRDKNSNEILFEELYDLTKDIMKVENVVTMPQYLAIRDSLKQELLTLILE